MVRLHEFNSSLPLSVRVPVAVVGIAIWFLALKSLSTREHSINNKELLWPALSITAPGA